MSEDENDIENGLDNVFIGENKAMHIKSMNHLGRNMNSDRSLNSLNRSSSAAN